MIEIILGLVLLQYIINYIFKPKLNILSCGIFGQASSTVLKLDVPSVNILGIYNIERGKQSCGLTWDGDIHHGIDKDKLYTDFIKNRQIKPKYFPTMFGHTRQASFGNGITLENAHPFGYGISADGNSYEFIFVHNGTLKNHKELAKKYNIDLTVKYQKKYSNSEDTYETSRDKIDSEILGEILWKEKSYHVLSEYIGAAACAWMWCNEPNKLYLWSGASKLHINDDTDKMFEERPLCVYTKSKNNMFFSSLEDSLTTIGGTLSNNIEQISRNAVHIITNGDYKNCEKIIATRKNAAQDDSYRYKDHPRQSNSAGYNRTQDYYDDIYGDWNDYPSQTNLNCNIKNVGLDISEDRPLFNINDYTGRIYSKGLRYWKNGHVINGIYIYILGYGFKKLGDSYVEAHTEIQRVQDRVFSVDDWSYTLKEGFIPIEKESNVQLHYFIDGAMLRTFNDYIKCLDLRSKLVTGSKYISMIELSYMTKHPVATLINTVKPQIYLDGNFYTGNTVELGFEKVYYFEKGKFIKWDKRLDLVDERPVIQLPMNFKREEEVVHNAEVLNECIKNIKALEKEWEDEVEKEALNQIIKTHFESEVEDNLSPEEDVNDFINDFLSEGFQTLISEVNSMRRDLKDYKDNPLVIDADRTLDTIQHVCNDYIIDAKKGLKDE